MRALKGPPTSWQRTCTAGLPSAPSPALAPSPATAWPGRPRRGAARASQPSWRKRQSGSPGGAAGGPVPGRLLSGAQGQPGSLRRGLASRLPWRRPAGGRDAESSSSSSSRQRRRRRQPRLGCALQAGGASLRREPRRRPRRRRGGRGGGRGRREAAQPNPALPSPSRAPLGSMRAGLLAAVSRLSAPAGRDAGGGGSGEQRAKPRGAHLSAGLAPPAAGARRPGATGMADPQRS
ncbi:translation initiation factor IF-2 [Sphaerodactylus townsendi]|uniref:translation initiation factor IF-2 n=1 Tax=Sphaerodactylus townsendi TaxID=933632 RepID=UPI0020271278|nr:translation initiation factor IF-2 [Sphaerodactylus townsendi]